MIFILLKFYDSQIVKVHFSSVAYIMVFLARAFGARIIMSRDNENEFGMHLQYK